MPDSPGTLTVMTAVLMTGDGVIETEGLCHNLVYRDHILFRLSFQWDRDQLRALVSTVMNHKILETSFQ